MTKLDHERGVLRLLDSTEHEPHWRGFEREKVKPVSRPKPQPDPKLMAEKQHFMELCAHALKNGHNFPKVPKSLRRLIIVNHKMDSRRLIWAWLGHQDEFDGILVRVQQSIGKRKRRRMKRAALTD